MATKKLSLKLLYDKECKKVLFAEAGNEAVDFLLYLLSLPLATVISLLFNSKKGMVGCLGNLYKSVQNLDNTYIRKGLNKDSLLNPVPSISQAHLLLPNVEPTPKWNPIKIYKCSHSSCSYRNYYVKDPTLNCPSGNHKMSCPEDPDVFFGKEAAAVISNEGGGFVKEMMTYMVMDDLEIKPMSTISGICLLNQFNVKDVRNLQEKVVDFDMDEGLKILEASLKGKEVLTSVFIQMVVKTR